jgi:hypothetical protein
VSNSIWSLFVLSLLIASSASAFVVNCLNPGHDSGFLTIHSEGGPNAELNGTVTFSGQQINDHFESHLKKIGARCGTFYVKQCSIPAKVFSNGNAIRTGNFEHGIQVYWESAGMKVVTLYNNKQDGKDWWFRTCTRSR